MSTKKWWAFVLLALTACSGTASGSPGGDGGARDGSDDALLSVDGAPVVDRDAAKAEAGTCTQTNGVSFGTEVCNRCIDAHCCDAVSACFANTDCSDLADCNTACVSGDAGGGDAGASCVATCRANHAASTTSYDAFVTCQSASCMTECK